MAHLSLWLTVCGIVLLCVAVPHASCHPSPVDSRHEIMPYYQQAEQPEQYRHSDDNDVENEDDAANEKINLQEFEPVLKDKVVDEELIWWNSRGIDAMIILGYIYFLYNVFRPDNYFPWTGRTLDDDVEDYPSSYNSNVTNSIMSDAFTLIMNRVDPVEVGMNILSIDARECRNRMVCEARHMVATVPLLDVLAQQYGWLLGSVPSYKEALSDGRSKGDCGQKYSQCPTTQLTRFYSILS